MTQSLLSGEMVLPLVIMAVLTLSALTMFAAGLHLVGVLLPSFGRAPGNEEYHEPAAWFRFGLRELFALTAIIAAYVALDQWLSWVIARAVASILCLVLGFALPIGWAVGGIFVLTYGWDSSRRAIGTLLLATALGEAILVAHFLAMVLAHWSR